MKSKDIGVRVMGKHELDWTTCYLLSRHVHKAAALEKVCKLLQKGCQQSYRDVRLQCVQSAGSACGSTHRLPFCKTQRAWVYEGYWPAKTLSKLRKFYPTIEGADHE